jgi:hypothetical protein
VAPLAKAVKTLYVLDTHVIRMDWFSRSSKGKNRVDGNRKRAPQRYPISQAVRVKLHKSFSFSFLSEVKPLLKTSGFLAYEAEPSKIVNLCF